MAKYEHYHLSHHILNIIVNDHSQFTFTISISFKIKGRHFWVQFQYSCRHNQWARRLERAGPTRRIAWLAGRDWPCMCDFVRDGQTVPPAFPYHTGCPDRSCPAASWWNFQLLFYSKFTQPSVMSYVTQGKHGTLVDPCLLSGHNNDRWSKLLSDYMQYHTYMAQYYRRGYTASEWSVKIIKTKICMITYQINSINKE